MSANGHGHANNHYAAWVVNEKSDHFGRAVRVKAEEWNGGGLWVEVEVVSGGCPAASSGDMGRYRRLKMARHGLQVQVRGQAHMQAQAKEN